MASIIREEPETMITPPATIMEEEQPATIMEAPATMEEQPATIMEEEPPATMEEPPAATMEAQPTQAFALPKTPEKTSEKPHANIQISYVFKDSAGINILSNPEVPNSGTFIAKSGSVSDITLSLVDVFEKILDRLKTSVNLSTATAATGKKTSVQQFSKFLLEAEKNIKAARSLAGRDNVAPVYEVMYNTILSPLMTTYSNIDSSGNISDAYIQSCFIGPSAIKAILDSGPLGETVLNAIDYRLLPCFNELAVNENDIIEYETIWASVTRDAPQQALIKTIDFWVGLEYCRVFQLVSSDIVGAINGLFPLRTIIDHTGFTGYINIPRGSGGQIGLDNKICVYSLFLYNVFVRHQQNFFNVKEQYGKLLQEFTTMLGASSDFLYSSGYQANIPQIQHSLTQLMRILETNTTGVINGSSADKSNKFIHLYNTYKIITLFAQFIDTHSAFFAKAIDTLNASYAEGDLVLHNSPNVTWLCFQLSRYQQTQKVYGKSEYVSASPEPPSKIIAFFNERKNQYCKYVQESRHIFQAEWYKALYKVYINEAFAGHDNNSFELTKVALDVFGSKKYKAAAAEAAAPAPSKSRGKAPKEVDKAEASTDEEQTRMEFSKFFTEFINNGTSYIGKPEQVIVKVLKESNCTVFSEAINVPDKSILWTVGRSAGIMINKRELGKKTKNETPKLPMNVTTVSLLDIITGQKGGENTINVVVDLAKYTPLPIINIRSVDQLQAIIPTSSPAEGSPAEGSDTETNADILLTNELLGKTVLKNLTVNTVYIPIISGIDAASFSKPNNARYSTGTITFPIDVGNGITMETTFKAGLDNTYVKDLYVYDHKSDAEPLFTVDAKIGKTLFATCLEFFYNKSESEKQTVGKICEQLNAKLLSVRDYTDLYDSGAKGKGKGKGQPLDKTTKFSFILKDKDGSPIKAVNTKSYKLFVQELLNTINPNIDPPKGYNDYYLFLEAAIPNINALHAPTLFTANSGLGNLWRQLINTIAGTDLLVAQAFIETIRILPNRIYETANGTGKVLDNCKIDIDKFINFIAQIQPKFPVSSTLTDAALQQAMSAEKITFCTCKIQDGQIHYKLVNKSEYMLDQFAGEMRDLQNAEFVAGLKSGLVLGAQMYDTAETAASLLMGISRQAKAAEAEYESDFDMGAESGAESGADSDFDMGADSDVDDTDMEEPPSPQKRKAAAVEAAAEAAATEVEAAAKKTRYASEWEIDIEIAVIEGNITEIQDFLSVTPVLLPLESENLKEKMRIAINHRVIESKQLQLVKYQEELASLERLKQMITQVKQGGGFGTVDNEDMTMIETELNQLAIEIAQLKAEEAELLVQLIAFTNGPISELEITKTAVLLGPTLFEKIAAALNLEKIAGYNKLFALNAGNVPFEANDEISTDPANTVLPAGTTLADFTDTIVTVKFVEGKFYMDSARKFLQSFLATYTAPSTVEKVEDVAAAVVEKVEDVTAQASATFEKVIDELTGTDKLTGTDELTGTDNAFDFTSSPPVSESVIAPAAGGSMKRTKKRRAHIKKVSKKKKNQHHRTINKKRTKRKGGKKPKKTKRRM